MYVSYSALGHLISTLVLEQRLCHYDGNFFNQGLVFLIEGQYWNLQVDRLCRDRMVWQPGEGVRRMMCRAGVVFDFEVELGKA
jgi:hypothetical protein